MDDIWVWAIGAVAIGIMSGLAGAGLLMMALTKGRHEDPLYRDSARSMAIMWFVLFTLAGIVIAVSIVNRDSFQDVPSRLVEVLPDLLIAGLIVVIGRAVALAAGSYVAKGLIASSGRIRDQVGMAVRTVITAAALVIALSQVGVNTALLQITGGALLFGLAAATALLVGFGGRDMAAEVAAGRYLARLIRPGDSMEVAIDGMVVAGQVIAMHPATVEVALAGGGSRHLPNSRILAAGPLVEPADPV